MYALGLSVGVMDGAYSIFYVAKWRISYFMFFRCFYVVHSARCSVMWTLVVLIT